MIPGVRSGVYPMLQTKPKEKPCANPACDNMFTPRFKSTERTCCYDCERAFQATKPKKENKHYTIPKFSKKRSKENKVYTGRRIVFLSKEENKFCKIKGPTCTILSTTIEHSMGRKGYANEEKRADGISLYLDEDYWLPACSCCNVELEDNPELSKKHQLSKIHGGKKI